MYVDQIMNTKHLTIALCVQLEYFTVNLVDQSPSAASVSY